MQFLAPGTEQCVSWDFITQDWTPNGCTTIVGEDNIVTCSCNHLTNFAVLVVSHPILLLPSTLERGNCRTQSNRTHGKKKKKKKINFSGKGRQSLHINVMRIRKMLISCVKLNHALYSINCGNPASHLILYLYGATKYTYPKCYHTRL